MSGDRRVGGGEVSAESLGLVLSLALGLLTVESAGAATVLGRDALDLDLGMRSYPGLRFAAALNSEEVSRGYANDTRAIKILVDGLLPPTVSDVADDISPAVATRDQMMPPLPPLPPPTPQPRDDYRPHRHPSGTLAVQLLPERPVERTIGPHSTYFVTFDNSEPAGLAAVASVSPVPLPNSFWMFAAAICLATMGVRRSHGRRVA